jgi:diguanylate cyclase (GGDEF)-like protein
MAEQSVEMFLVGKSIKRKLVISHLLSSLVPFLVVLYLLITYVTPYIPASPVYTQMLIAIFGLIGVLVFVGYGVAWDIGHALSSLAQNAEAQEGFESMAQRGDEIGQVMRSFSNTLEMLKKRTEEVNEFSEKLETANKVMAAMNRSLQQISYTDELTGLYNRRFFNRALEEELSRSERYQRSFSLTLLDIDHFKRINDDYGHYGGDMVLSEVGRILEANSRASDVVSRFGGEEFAVILPETDLDKAKHFAEKMLQSVRDCELSFDDGSTEKITASVGLSVYPSGGGTFDELVSGADQALHRAKEEGRDRVCAHETPAA